jgi:SAM-dependent methyltransferase
VPEEPVPEEPAPLWADQEFLRDIQYADDRNLAARQSIYAYARPRRDLPALVLDSLALDGRETVVDVGCGNGLYLTELARRGHRGPVAGVDMSPGMLAAARGRAPAAHPIGGDAVHLPLRTASSDVTLAMHMLYHVAEPSLAVAELRRVTRPGGLAVIALNAEDHLAELRDLINSELGGAGLPPDLAVREPIRLDQGHELLAAVFGSVTRHDLPGQLMLPGPQPVADYVRSIRITRRLPEQERLVEAVTARLAFGSDGLFRVTTHCGWLICT